MAADQKGTVGLTLAGQATTSGRYIDVPVGAIVESVTVNNGGSPQYEDVVDENGAFHTRITFEDDMTTATIVLIGVEYPTAAGGMDGNTNVEDCYVESVSEENSKGPVRTTITVTHIPTVSHA